MVWIGGDEAACERALNRVVASKRRSGGHRRSRGGALNIKGHGYTVARAKRERDGAEAIFIDRRLVFPKIVAGQIDVLPREWGQTGEQIIGDGLSGVAQGIDPSSVLGRSAPGSKDDSDAHAFGKCQDLPHLIEARIDSNLADPGEIGFGHPIAE